MPPNGSYNISHKKEVIIQALLEAKSVKEASLLAGAGRYYISLFKERLISSEV